jgi:hypothetical protein
LQLRRNGKRKIKIALVNIVQQNKWAITNKKERIHPLINPKFVAK